MIRTYCWLTTLIAVSLIWFPKTAQPAVVGVKDTLISAVTTTNSKRTLMSAALPGDLDPTYGTEGKVRTDFPTDVEVLGAAVQPDGKIVVVGATNLESSFIIARYTLNGSPDPTFGSPNGILTSPFAVLPRAIAVQGDSKIIVGGQIGDSFGLFRLNPNGSTDETFGSSGLVTIRFSSKTLVRDIAFQPDRKIVVIGSANTSFLLARLNTNGTLDTTYGDGGTISANMGPNALALAFAIQPDLKVVAVGQVASELAVARISPDGQFDAGFGNGGKITIDFDGGVNAANDVVLQPDGKIVVAGFASFGLAGRRSVIVRFNSDGSPDTTFGQDGTVQIGLIENIARSLVLQANGKIVVAGWFFDGGGIQNDFLVLRLNTDGTLDDSFAGGGLAITDFGGVDFLSKMMLQPDGKVVAAGAALNGHAIALARYLTIPLDEPILQTEAGSNHAIALDSVTFRRDPFSVTNDANFSADHRTRITLFAANLTLSSEENFSAVTVLAEDSVGVHNLPVEFVGTVPGFEWLTQIVVKLPDELAEGNVLVSVSFHGNTSNEGFIVIE